MIKFSVHMIGEKRKEPRICTLILGSEYEPWNLLYSNGPLKTWIKDWKSDSQALFFTYSGQVYRNRVVASFVNSVLRRRILLPLWTSSKRLPEANFHDSGIIKVKIEERWDTMTLKFLSASRLLLETFDFEYLIRTNTTTYVNRCALMKVIESGENYMGASSKNEKFAVGWGQIISRSAVEAVVENFGKIKIDKKLFEDEYIGTMLDHLGYNFVPVKSKSLVVVDENLSIEEAQETVFTRLYLKKGKVRCDAELFNDYHKFASSQFTFASDIRDSDVE